MEGKVALEEHFTTEVNNSFWDAKGEEGRNGLVYSKDVERRLLDTDLMLGEMDRAGIEMSILSLTSPGVQGVVDPRKATDLARSANDYAAALTRAHPDRLSAFAAVALQDPEGAVEELRRSVQSLGFKGVLVNGYSNIGSGEEVRYLDDALFAPFWTAVEELSIPVYLHPREPLASQTRNLQNFPELGGSAWAFTYETSTHALRLLLSGLFDTHPGVQIILGHLGEGLPYILPRFQHRLDEQYEGMRGAKAKRRPSYYFANNFWLTTSGHHHSNVMLQAVEQIGPERVMFSVDYPYEQMGSASRWFDDALLPAELKAKIGRENANRLFKLNLPKSSVAEAVGFGS